MKERDVERRDAGREEASGSHKDIQHVRKSRWDVGDPKRGRKEVSISRCKFGEAKLNFCNRIENRPREVNPSQRVVITDINLHHRVSAIK